MGGPQGGLQQKRSNFSLHGKPCLLGQKLGLNGPNLGHKFILPVPWPPLVANHLPVIRICEIRQTESKNQPNSIKWPKTSISFFSLNFFWEKSGPGVNYQGKTLSTQFLLLNFANWRVLSWIEGFCFKVGQNSRTLMGHLWVNKSSIVENIMSISLPMIPIVQQRM